MAPIGTARAKPGVARKRRRNEKQSDGNDGIVVQRQGKALVSDEWRMHGRPQLSNGKVPRIGAKAKRSHA